MEGPMESAPYGLTPVNPSLLRHIPRFSASCMLGEKTTEKGSEIGKPKRDARKETVEIDMSSLPAAWTCDARAAYEGRVAEMDSENVEDQVDNHGSKTRGQAYGPWSIRAWEKPDLERQKTWRCEDSTPTP